MPGSSPTQSVEVAEDLATDVLSLGLLMIHDAVGGCEDDLTKLSGGKNVIDKLLEVLQLKVISRRDDSAFVKSAVQLNNNFA